MLCEVCKKELVSTKALSQHIRFHNITSQEYYDKYLGNSKECEECGKKTNFLDLTRGYQKFCSLRCSNNNKNRKEKFRESYLRNDLEQIKNKRKKTNFERYGNENANQIEEIKEKTLTTFRKNRLPIIRKQLEVLDLQLVSSNYESCYNKETEIRCLKCNKIFKESIFNISQRMYPCSCQIRYSRSNKEVELFNFVYSLDPTCKSNEKIDNIELDIFISSKNIAIEYNGIYWHSDRILKDPVNYHCKKLSICDKNGIKLIQVFEDEWVLKKEIVKSRLKRIILNNKYDDIVRIHGRKCTIKRVIDNKVKNDFLNSYHLQGSDISEIAIGAFYNDELVSIMTFSHGNISKGSKKTEYVWELSRFCIKIGYHIPGISGKLLSYFKKNFKWKEIFSYADRRWSDGDVYYKLGFNLNSITKPNYWYTKDGTKRIHRFNLRKKEEEPSNIPEWVLRLQEGYYRIWDCGNLKFSMINKTEEIVE